MGLNMPARTVLFTSLKKFDGKENRIISSGEYIQMSGRAGRRGKDKKGYVVIMLDAFVKKEDCKELLMGKSHPLQSSFRLNYYTLLNLLRKVEGTQQSIDDIIRKSFNQFQHERTLPELERKIRELKDKTDAVDIDKAQIRNFRKRSGLESEAGGLRRRLHQAKIHTPSSLNLWLPGRCVLIRDRGVGIVLGIEPSNKGKIYTLDVALPVTSNQSQLHSPIESSQVASSLAILPVELEDVEEVFKIILELGPSLMSEEEKLLLLRQLNAVLEIFDNRLPICQWIQDIPVRDASILTDVKRLEALERELLSTDPTPTDIDEALKRRIEEKIEAMTEIDRLNEDMNRSMMTGFKEEYKARVASLKKLGHVNDDGVLTLKGKAACEIDAGDALVCAELLFDGILTRVDPSYLLSFLSCLVPFSDQSKDTCQQRHRMSSAFEVLQSSARHVAEISVDCKIDMDIASYVDGFHLCLVDVMYAWSTGSTFGEICTSSSIFEGVIIRSARRLAELIQQLSSGARVMGDMALVKILDDTNIVLKRDIMFAASLYV